MKRSPFPVPFGWFCVGWSGDVLALVRRGSADQVSLSTRFIPMHRIENLYLDERSSGVPSLAELFRERTGIEPLAFLMGEAEP